jgi:hypothetical protein
MSRRPERPRPAPPPLRRAPKTPAPGPEGVLSQIPGWVFPALFAVLTVVLFRGFVFSREMLLGMDTLSLGYQARVFFARALSETGFPQWNPHILGGTPFLESLAGGDSLHPLSVALLMLVEPYRALGWKLVVHVFLAGIFMAGWIRTLGGSRGAALLGGVGALLAPSFVTLVFPGHDGKMYVVAMTPLVFLLAERVWQGTLGRALVQGAFLSLAIALVLFSTHFQMAYFLFGAVGLWMAFRGVRIWRAGGARRAASRFALFLSFSVLGAGVGAVQLVPAVGYVTEYSRRASTTVGAESPEAARAYSASWSLHPEEALSLFLPEFVGNSAGGAPWTTETYWGRNPFKLNHEYLGILLFALALLAFLPVPPGQGGREGGGSDGRVPGDGGGDHALVHDRPTRWFLAGLATVFALFALGANTPVWRLFYELVPGISLFRAPSMAIFLSAFALTTLAAFGLDRGVRIVASGAEGDAFKRLVRRLGGVGGALLLVAILTAAGVFLPLWESLLYPELNPGRAMALDRLTPFIVQGAFLGSVLVGALLFLFWGMRRGSIPSWAFVPGVLLLVTVDLFRVSAPFVQVTDPTRVTVPDANLQFLLARAREEPPFRVFSMLQGGQDVQPSAFGLDLAAGHHPNDLGRYRELIGMEGSGIPEHLATFHPVVARILNVRYILWPDAQYGSIEGVEPLHQISFPDGRAWVSVLPYPGFPRARLVAHHRVVEPGGALAILLHDPTFDPWAETLLEGPLPDGLPVGSLDPESGDLLPAEGSVAWRVQEPDRLVLDVDSPEPTLLLVSQNWFPTWTATVDGVPAPILRADHALQAIPIPGGGRVQVVLEVRGPEPRISLLLSGLSLLLVTGLGVGGLVVGRRKREGDPEPG